MTRIMATTQHPTMDTLAAYLEAPEQADFKELRLHIAACGECRGNIVKLHTVQNTLQQSGWLHSRIDSPSAQLAEALQQQSIERFIDGELQGAQAAHIRALLQTDAYALKAALHYASHRSDSLPPQSAPIPKTVTNTSVSTRTGRLSTLFDGIKKLLDFRPPVWISVPATAAVVVALATAIFPSGPMSPAPHMAIATYQDKAVIHFQGANPLPGIGFFSRAHSSTQAFGPMTIHYDKSQTLSLHWPQVADAATYHLALYLIRDGQKITVKALDTTTPQALITDFKPTESKRYEWTLNGETKDAGTFYTSGGFVINNL